MSKNQKPPIDPVILAVIGVLFVSVAAGLAVFQSNPSNDSGTMNKLLLAFITGLTTGGLTCLAVQGGLLAS